MQREADIFSFARCGSPCGYVATDSFETPIFPAKKTVIMTVK